MQIFAIVSIDKNIDSVFGTVVAVIAVNLDQKLVVFDIKFEMRYEFFRSLSLDLKAFALALTYKNVAGARNTETHALKSLKRLLNIVGHAGIKHIVIAFFCFSDIYLTRTAIFNGVT